MEGIKMTNLVKKLSLSLVITTIITTNVLAKQGDLFEDSSLESSSLGSTPKVSPQDLSKTVFEDPQDIQKERAYQTEKKFLEALQESHIQLVESEDFLSPLTLNQNKKSEDDASKIFPPLDEKQLEENRKNAQLLRDNEVARQLLQRFMDEQARNRQPSTLWVAGEYAYSATKTTLGYGLRGLDYVARSRPAAYYASYLSVAGLEELAALTSYATGAVIGGKPMGDGAYYATKAGLKIASTVIPCWKGAVAASTYREANWLINAGLDVAPVVASTVYSGAKTVAEGTVYVAKTAASVVGSTVSFVGSAVSYVSSFWGK